MIARCGERNLVKLEIPPLPRSPSRRSESSPRPPNPRTARAVNYRHNADLRRSDDVEHTYWKTPHPSPAQAAVQLRVKEREPREPLVDDVKLVEELAAETRALLFVPRERGLDIALGLRPNANVSNHQLASNRCFSSAQGTPASGSRS